MSKARTAWGFRWTLVILALLGLIWFVFSRPTPPATPNRGLAPPARAGGQMDWRPALLESPSGGEACGEGLADAAARNRAGLDTLAFATFHRPEVGWAAYAPLAGRAVGSACAPDSPSFASRLASWQASHALPPSGVMDEATLNALMGAWQARRRFVRESAAGCPQPPPEAGLTVVPARDSYGGKTLLLRPAAVGAYERMLEAARQDLPQMRRDRALMTVFSAYRSPESDALRCAIEGNCQNVVRTTCSAHLTGLAVDLYLGAAPGFRPDSSADENRRFIAGGAAYRWMVANADRFGFVPYPFEPWHWEWTGEPA